jgi:hypothetical protein
MLLKKVFETTGINEDKVEGPLKLAVKAPSARNKADAQLYRAKTYSEAVRAGAMLRAELNKYLRDRELWDDKQEAEFERLRKSVVEGEKVLETKRHPDGRPVRLSEAREIALRVRREREALQGLLGVRNGIDANTADAIADNASFNFLVAACTVYQEGRFVGKPYFTTDAIIGSVDVYIERGSEQVAIDAATNLSELLYGSEKDLLEKLPENQFLKQFKFVNEDLQLVNKDGHLISESGKLIDKEGYYVNEDGHRIDIEGNLVTDDGRYVADSEAYFLDDEDNPIVEAVVVAPETPDN